MDGLEKIQEYIKGFICEKNNIQEQIAKIEEKRTQLAQERNAKKKTDGVCETVNQLGKQIAELGNKSQELQEQLDFKSYSLKTQINSIIDNLIAEGIRKIRIANDEVYELREKSEKQKERNEKYQLQKQEFYVRFGRMPELSERASKESKLQEKETEKSILEIQELNDKIAQIENELDLLAKTKIHIKNGDWKSIVEEEKSVEDLRIEEIRIEEMEPIEEIYVEEFEPVEELYVEEFQPIEELHVEEFKLTEEKVEELKIETTELIEENPVDEIEKLARAIVEEIVAEQTKEYDVHKIEETEESEETEIIFAENAEDIIAYEKEKKGKVIIPLFGQRATISNITVKFEEGNLVYKAQMTDDEEVKIYPSRLGEESVILRDKQNREECKEILINYAISEHRIIDKSVINKIDPLVCELLIECAERYGHNAKKLVYNYAESFASGEIENVPGIIYNLSYIEQSNLCRKEKMILNKICKNARKNNNIDVIETFSGFRKIKYIFKRLLSINNIKVLPEAKY